MAESCFECEKVDFEILTVLLLLSPAEYKLVLCLYVRMIACMYIYIYACICACVRSRTPPASKRLD
jgi:hypothetical protein